MASRCAPRATSTTSWPCWNMRPPTTPPTAPGPIRTMPHVRRRPGAGGGAWRLRPPARPSCGDGRQRAVTAPHEADLAGRQLRRQEPDVELIVPGVHRQQRHHGPAHAGAHHRHLGAVVVRAEDERRDWPRPCAARSRCRSGSCSAGSRRAAGRRAGRSGTARRAARRAGATRTNGSSSRSIESSSPSRWPIVNARSRSPASDALGTGVVVLLLEQADVDGGVLAAQLRAPSPAGARWRRDWNVPMSMRPTVPATKRSTASPVASTRAMMSRAWPRTSLPSGVSATGRGPPGRSNSWLPTRRSSVAICWLTADWV